MEQDRHDEALAVLTKLHGNAAGTNAAFVELEFREIRDVIEADRSVNQITWSSIFKKASWRRRLLLGCGVQAFGPLSGINVINYYGPRIYAVLGIDTQTSLMIIGISGALSIIYCSIGLWALERVGRVKPLIVSAAGCAIALLVNAALSQHLDGASNNQLRAMVAMNFIFSLFYTPTGIISWVYPAEIFPVDIRAKGNSIATFTNWTINLVFAQITPVALTAMGFKYFYVFFALGAVATVNYAMFYPETKGRTLEQMDELFGDQLVPHALEDPEGAEAARKTSKVLVEHAETEK
jgi:Sugar (and other) transporter